MKSKGLVNKIGLIGILMALGVAGCRSASAPVTFYTLSAIEKPADPALSVLKDKVITIGPVRLPDFLDRPQIVTRSGENRLNLSEFHRWAGDLDGQFQNLLAENLSLRLNSPRVLVYPWKDQVNPDYQVSLEVHQFEGNMGGAVVLNVTWAVKGPDGAGEPLLLRRSVIRKETPGNGYDALVSAHSQAVGELSDEIAAAMVGLVKK